MTMTILDWLDPDRHRQEPQDPNHGKHEGPDYEHGYAHGKEKAHFEIREQASTETSHAPSCECEPCKTLFAAAIALTFEAAYDTIFYRHPHAEATREWIEMATEIAGRCSTSDEVVRKLAIGLEGLAIAESANLALKMFHEGLGNRADGNEKKEE